MATRLYNQFFPGIKQDDFLTGGANFIEGNNVTGLNTGYGAVLGPKVNKQLLTNGNAPRTIFGRQLNSGSLDLMAVGCDNGEIYKLSGVDNTPIYTQANGYDIVNGANLLTGSNFMYFASRTGGADAKLMQVTSTDFSNETFASANENFLTFNHTDIPPMMTTGTFLYVGGLNAVHRIDGAGTIVSKTIFNRYVTGITKHGTQFMVYTDAGEVSYWDGVSSSVTANIQLGFIPARVTSDGGVDHIISQDGDYYIGSGYTFQLITRKRQSNRLEDNSQYIKKFDFTPNTLVGQLLSMARGGTYMISSDTKPGIYRRDKLIEGLSESFHKSITRDNTNVEFDEIFTSTYISKGHSKLFFGFQSGTTTFGVDYIDLNSKLTAKDGYLISDVFSGGTAFEKKIEVIRFAMSFENATDYLKLYKRINNGTWEQITLTDNLNNTITRENLTTHTDGFIDIQFKIEFHNEAQDENSPMLGELSMDYNVIKT